MKRIKKSNPPKTVLLPFQSKEEEDMKPFALISLVLTVLAIPGAFAQAAEVRVLSSNGVHSVMVEMVPAFERATGQKVSIDYYTANQIVDRIKGGEKADLVIITRPTVDAMIKEGKIVAGSDKVVGRSGVGVAIRAGLPKPDISTPDKLKQALLNAKSIAFTKTGGSGIHFANVIKRLGIADQVNAKAKIPEGGAVGPLVASGEAEMAVQQIPELLAVKEIQYVGPFPPELQIATVFTTGVMTDARQPEAAKALIDFLTTPAAVKLFAAKGLEP
jgi:molybdate transport system substrate-binding protein